MKKIVLSFIICILAGCTPKDKIQEENNLVVIIVSKHVDHTFPVSDIFF